VNKDQPINKLTPILYHKYSQIPKPQNLYFGVNWKTEYLKKLEKLSKKIKNTTNEELINELFTDLPKDLNFLNVLTRGLTRSIKLFNASCVLCNSKDNIQIHHIKSVKDIKGKTSNEIKIKSFARKQIPLCAECHLLIHNKNWRNNPMKPK
jgi:hypothetical protein